VWQRDINAFILGGVSPRAIKSLRKSLGLTQQAFANLLGLSFVSINKWENDASAPTGLSEVMLYLLAAALRVNSPRRVVADLLVCNGKPIDVIRMLTQLERTHAPRSA
jgi:transcriptional regulator with XRE-family HTH domain